MHRLAIVILGWTLGFLPISFGSAFAEGDVKAGARVFRACAACHSLESGRHLTGPSLADLWGRKAGSVGGFARYSTALKSAEVVWTEETLDAWLAAPQELVPGNTMTFSGLEEPKARADLIAFLKAAGGDGAIDQTAQGNMMGGGMMQGPKPQNLRTLGPQQHVTDIRHCGDTYRVTTAAGELPPFWELNLRFKTDSSETGPVPGQPAIMPAGMMGDRASVIFADPTEISTFIKTEC